MVDFDFISGDAFRKSLESDYQELLVAINGGAWKAAHVLAGSIVEAILLDCLVAIKYDGKSEETILKMTLADAVNACKKEGYLSLRAADLSSVVRDYRNLIHPGKVVRTKEEVDKDSAVVAQALVAMIIKDIAAKRTKKFGYTAEQVITKLRSDDSVGSILSYLMSETLEPERCRLLIDVLPQAYYEVSNSTSLSESNEVVPVFAENGPVRRNMRECFNLAFSLSSDDMKTVVAQRFVKILKEQAGEFVRTYENAFFRGYQLAYLSLEDQSLVVGHIADQMDKLAFEPIDIVSRFLEGIGTCLTDTQQCRLFLYSLVRYYLMEDVTSSLAGAIAYEHQHMMPGLQSYLMFVIERDIRTYEQTDKDVADRMQNLKDTITNFDGVPF